MSRHNADMKFVNIEQFALEGGPRMQIKRVFHADSAAAAPMHTRLDTTTLTNRQMCMVGWVTDDSVSSCMHCGCPFSILVRRHHCRCCGDLVCTVGRYVQYTYFVL